MAGTIRSISDMLAQTKAMVDKEEYFVTKRPHLCGKTTMLAA